LLDGRAFRYKFTSRNVSFHEGTGNVSFHAPAQWGVRVMKFVSRLALVGLVAGCTMPPPPPTSYIPNLGTMSSVEAARETDILARCQTQYPPQPVGMVVAPAGAAGSAVGLGFAPPEALLGGVAASNDQRIAMEAAARKAAGDAQVACAKRYGIAAVAPPQPEQRLLPKAPYIGAEIPTTTVTQQYSNGTTVTTQTPGGVYAPGAYGAALGDTAPIIVAPPPVVTPLR
jgi:hypothetical protein